MIKKMMRLQGIVLGVLMLTLLVTAAQAIPTLTLISPNGDADWRTGETHAITWSQTGLSGTSVRIDLMVGTDNLAFYRTIRASVPASDGTFSWTIPHNIPTGDHYRIQVKSLTYPSVLDFSAGRESITNVPPTLTLISPNGDADWRTGETHAITWSQTGLSGTSVRIDLMVGTDNLAFYRTIRASVPASAGTFSWTIPHDIPTGDHYRIQVKSLTYPDVLDFSAGRESITNAAPTVEPTVEPTEEPTTQPTAEPTVPGTTPTPVSGATYTQARAYYEAAGEAWSRAWGASDITLIRQYLVEAKTAYTNCLNTANGVNDPANAANLALLKSISTAYIDLADAALAMYDGADVYTMGRNLMTAGNYGAAAQSFQSAATQFDSSRTLFGQATTTLQSVVYTGTEYGDGTAYTAMIVPILNAKAAYMGEFSTYAQGWQHTALAYQARQNGDDATFRSEAVLAMTLFDGLRASAAFGADAAANYDVLAGLLA